MTSHAASPLGHTTRTAPDVAHPTGMPIVAMVGGGQLSRMTAEAAAGLGHTLRVLAGSQEESAAQVSPDVVLGDHNDLDAIRRVADGAHVVTFDHEHVPQEVLSTVLAEGVNLQPRPNALRNAQDKLVMRTTLASMGAPVPPFAGIDDQDDLEQFWKTQGGAVVIKAARGGYDGKGVWIPDTFDEARDIVEEQLAAGTPLLAERKVAWDRELSAMVARSPEGQGAVWPVVESVQRDGVCAVALAPAPDLPADVASRAQELALRIARDLDVTGVLAVELFLTGSEILVNELAMRPHNTGHWTQDGCVTSQFEQHLRAVLDYPLGDTTPLAPITVMANVLGAPNAGEEDAAGGLTMDERCHHVFARFPEAKVHLYGKRERPGRKLGHVTVVASRTIADDLGIEWPGAAAVEGTVDPRLVVEVRRRAELAAHWLATGEWGDGWDIHTGRRG